ncbi:MAG: hypothetical protein J0H68_02560 [Sphingobacteriia bacterium]|nr:hypothetical protein [Sphingobacteriia bacterium]
MKRQLDEKVILDVFRTVEEKHGTSTLCGTFRSLITTDFTSETTFNIATLSLNGEEKKTLKNIRDINSNRCKEDCKKEKELTNYLFKLKCNN